MKSHQKSDAFYQCVFTTVPNSSQFDLKDGALGFFEEVAPNKKKNNSNKMVAI